jgi:anti-sigma factor RsiW
MLRRELNPEEERFLGDWLSTRPAEAAAWRADVAIARALRRLPPVAIPSNFTARVLAEVQRDVPRRAPRRRSWLPAWEWTRERWLPVASAVMVLALGAGAWRYHATRQQSEFNRGVAALRVLSAVSPEVLQDFEVIQHFREDPAPIDYELLAALQ